MSAREQAALSAMGAALASVIELGDVLEAGHPRAIIDEANYALRARGLRIVAIHTNTRVLWKVCES